MEKVVAVSEREYLGPQAISLVVEMLSHFAFNATVDKVLAEQHRSLAAKVADTVEVATANEPSGLSVEIVVRLAESRARAEKVLGFKDAQSGASYNRRALSFFSLSSEENFSAQAAARLVIAWARLERKYPSFNAPADLVKDLARKIKLGARDLSLKQLRGLAGAVASLEFASPGAKRDLLHIVSSEIVARLALGRVTTKQAGVILAVALHSSATI